MHRLSLVCTVVVTAACSPAQQLPEQTARLASGIQVWGEIDGDMPTVGAFDHTDTSMVSAYGYDGESGVFEVHAVTEQGWAMFGIQLDRDAEFGPTTIGPGVGLGCSGPYMGMFDFDAPPDEIVVNRMPDVIDGVVGTRIDLDAHYPEGGYTHAELFISGW